MSGSGGEKVYECMVCYDLLDATDRCFHPCPCGYQMCSFCFNRIKEMKNEVSLSMSRWL